MNAWGKKHLHLTTARATARLAASIGQHLTAGHTVLLSGDLGSGKTHFARSIIQSRLAAQDRSEDVPSPTFTLIQEYSDGIVDMVHADLYRLTGPDEVIELGLADAFLDAVCLVEWPDRLGTLTPADALTIEFMLGDAPQERWLNMSWHGEKWQWLSKLIDDFDV